MKVVISGTGLLTNNTEQLDLRDVFIEQGANVTARGLRLSGSIYMNGDAVLQPVPGGMITITGHTEIIFSPDVVVVDGLPRYAVPFINLGTVGANFNTLPGSLTVNLSADAIAPITPVTKWSEPVVAAQTLNCKEWQQKTGVGDTSVFGTICQTDTGTHTSGADNASASTLFVRGLPPLPAYTHEVQGTAVTVIMFVIAACVVIGTIVVLFIICKGPLPPEKSRNDNGTDDENQLVDFQGDSRSAE
jgi:hypothetical protein